MKFYRYTTFTTAAGGLDYFDNFVYHGDNVDIVLEEYNLVRETLKGYWIVRDLGGGGEQKWISKTSRKRFAYPTKAEALNSFIIRTTRRVGYLERDLENAKLALHLANHIEL